jgi:serine protease Do
VPLNANVGRIIEVLKRGEEVDYGFLGIGTDGTPANGRPGVVLTRIFPGSPADIDGKLMEHDVLLSINGNPLRDTEDIFVQVATQLAGTKVRLVIQRGGAQFPVDVTLAKLNVPTKAIASSLGSRPYVRGLRVDYSSLVVQQGTGSPTTLPKGVFVCDVQPKSIAERANFRTGAVITHINDRPVATPAEFYQAMPAMGPVELTLLGNPNQPPVRISLR